MNTVRIGSLLSMALLVFEYRDEQSRDGWIHYRTRRRAFAGRASKFDTRHGQCRGAESRNSGNHASAKK